jgi:preprotein translocase subunit SecD
MRWLGIFLLLASPAIADPALISFQFAGESILVRGEEIEKAEAAINHLGAPAVDFRLDQGFDARFAQITPRYIGKKISIRICGELVLEPVLQTPLYKADFVITTVTMAEASRLASILNTKTCPDGPAG